ncbi:PHD finger domain protein [Blumeria hordei DH14]|uniref:PHD finger domain protein n=1 Tax=Blumeria graminis f. sp. hordei (strain DH14) TaxID=546991 RepID=N1JDT1_BLUG1|nr:PHD finger domain protein [Blumeria hordei DH14]
MKTSQPLINPTHISMDDSNPSTQMTSNNAPVQALDATKTTRPWCNRAELEKVMKSILNLQNSMEDLDIPMDPDAQATVTDFLDFTEYLPSDIIRSLTLVGNLDQSYCTASKNVHDLTKKYGSLPSMASEMRPDPVGLRADISRNLDDAAKARTLAHAEACRMLAIVRRHHNRIQNILVKLRDIADNYPTQEVTVTSTKPKPPTIRTPKPRLQSDAPTSENRTRKKCALRITVPGEVLAPYECDYPSYTEESDNFDSDEVSPLVTEATLSIGGQSRPKPKFRISGKGRKKEKASRSPRVPGMMGTNVHSSIAGISTSNALAQLQPPPPDAKPGDKDLPWLQLNAWELAKLRKRMKKNAIWSPSDTMIARELKSLGRGIEAYRISRQQAEEAGIYFDINEPPQIRGETVHGEGAISVEAIRNFEPQVFNRGMKLNEMKKQRRDKELALAAEEAEEAARQVAASAEAMKDLFQMNKEPTVMVNGLKKEMKIGTIVETPQILMQDNPHDKTLDPIKATVIPSSQCSKNKIPEGMIRHITHDIITGTPRDASEDVTMTNFQDRTQDSIQEGIQHKLQDLASEDPHENLQGIIQNENTDFLETPKKTIPNKTLGRNRHLTKGLNEDQRHELHRTSPKVVIQDLLHDILPERLQEKLQYVIRDKSKELNNYINYDGSVDEDEDTFREVTCDENQDRTQDMSQDHSQPEIQNRLQDGTKCKFSRETREVVQQEVNNESQDAENKAPEILLPNQSEDVLQGHIHDKVCDTILGHTEVNTRSSLEGLPQVSRIGTLENDMHDTIPSNRKIANKFMPQHTSNPDSQNETFEKLHCIITGTIQNARNDAYQMNSFDKASEKALDISPNPTQDKFLENPPENLSYIDQDKIQEHISDESLDREMGTVLENYPENTCATDYDLIQGKSLHKIQETVVEKYPENAFAVEEDKIQEKPIDVSLDTAQETVKEKVQENSSSVDQIKILEKLPDKTQNKIEEHVEEHFQEPILATDPVETEENPPNKTQENFPANHYKPQKQLHDNAFDRIQETVVEKYPENAFAVEEDKIQEKPIDVSLDTAQETVIEKVQENSSSVDQIKILEKLLDKTQNKIEEHVEEKFQEPILAIATIDPKEKMPIKTQEIVTEEEQDEASAIDQEVIQGSNSSIEHELEVKESSINQIICKKTMHNVAQVKDQAKKGVTTKILDKISVKKRKREGEEENRVETTAGSEEPKALQKRAKSGTHSISSLKTASKRATKIEPQSTSTSLTLLDKDPSITIPNNSLIERTSLSPIKSPRKSSVSIASPMKESRKSLKRDFRGVEVAPNFQPTHTSDTSSPVTPLPPVTEAPSIKRHPTSRSQKLGLDAGILTATATIDRPRRTSTARTTPAPDSRSHGKRGKRPELKVITTSSGTPTASNASKRGSATRKKPGNKKDKKDGRERKFSHETYDEIDEEGNPIDPDEPRYCHCNRVSFGVMIGCEGAKCEKEWFHLECVGLLDIPPRTTKWYCPTCRVALGIGERGEVNARGIKK